ncbi:MAG: hypothetical protein JNJ69_04545 [Leptospiraceae bacterium]|nr:hypothetical protein [Leptospiraceae bacterium]
MKKISIFALCFGLNPLWSLGVWLEPHVGYGLGNHKQGYSLSGSGYVDSLTASARQISASNNGLDFGGKLGAFQKIVPGIVALSGGLFVNMSTVDTTPDSVLYNSAAKFGLASSVGAFLNADLPIVSIWGAYLPAVNLKITDVYGSSLKGTYEFAGSGYAFGLAYRVLKGLRVQAYVHGETYATCKGCAIVNNQNSGSADSLPIVAQPDLITRRFDSITTTRYVLAVSYALILFDEP